MASCVIAYARKEGYMPSRQDTSPTQAKQGAEQTESAPAAPDHGSNSASTVIEAPQKPAARDSLDPHDFPSGGGSGGAQAFSRKTLTLKKKKEER
jgi:hypothetical protein